MTKFRLYKFFLLVLLAAFIRVASACKNNDSQAGNTPQMEDLNATSAGTSSLDHAALDGEWLPPMQIPFIELQRYFVRTDVDQPNEFKFESKGQFEGVFSPAATMNEGGQPMEIQFDKDFVIAVVLPETDVETEVKAVSLQRLSDGALLFTYKVDRGSKQSFTMKPFLAVVVEKQFDGRVVLREEQ